RRAQLLSRVDERFPVQIGTPMSEGFALKDELQELIEIRIRRAKRSQLLSDQKAQSSVLAIARGRSQVSVLESPFGFESLREQRVRTEASCVLMMARVGGALRSMTQAIVSKHGD